MGIVTRHGYCRFCNNPRMVEVDEDADQDERNQVASEECDCTEAEAFRKKVYQKRACLANIDEMISKKYPAIAEILKGCIDDLQDFKFKKITINGYDNITVKIHQNKDGIKIELERKLKEENLA